MRRRYYQHPKFGECVAKDPKSMPRMFNELAAYNGRVASGVLHDEDYRARMSVLQAQFNEWRDETLLSG